MIKRLETQTKTQLAPCPFCQAGAGEWGVGLACLVDSFKQGIWVECRSCGARGPMDNEQEFAVAAWNCNRKWELLEALQGCLLFFQSAKATAWIKANRADDKEWAMAAAMEMRRDQALAAIAKATGKGGE